MTGATDGIGLETVKMLGKEGHNIIIHGRSKAKLDNIKGALEALYPGSTFAAVQADLSLFDDVKQLAVEVKAKYKHLF
ncbi:SDR family NAD(P)-dependent oxidoreductase [Alteromonas sp.]|uniref:SDR family NAD(P)-dependent oxidoreductase n=1 Tax=Alteromonas sp. TaxID=232 RepID=UPI00257F04C9|nr:SDR family NAD(P)-dependent oxidoreductase [Alteromonas sp.]NQY17270.1 SDR family NAD(P)-dependent oxidoreductase [Alteromonas sp.]